MQASYIVPPSLLTLLNDTKMVSHLDTIHITSNVFNN